MEKKGVVLLLTDSQITAARKGAASSQMALLRQISAGRSGVALFSGHVREPEDGPLRRTETARSLGGRRGTDGYERGIFKTSEGDAMRGHPVLFGGGEGGRFSGRTPACSARLLEKVVVGSETRGHRTSTRDQDRGNTARVVLHHYIPNQTFRRRGRPPVAKHSVPHLRTRTGPCLRYPVLQGGRRC